MNPESNQPVEELGESSCSVYDVVDYPTGCHAQTHPSRMAALGMLWGMEPEPVRQARILELGCGDGSNLIALAHHFPDCQCLGVDLARRPVEAGRRMVSELGLRNVRLEWGDLTELSGKPGTVDYLVAHGVYSWVPERVRESVLSLCGRMLSERGMAFVSFNTLPGAHPKLMIREMLLRHLGEGGNAEERIRQGRAFLGLLLEGSRGATGFRGAMVREYERLLEGHPGQMFHDEMSGEHAAFYFTDFMNRASAHGLEYVSDADLFEEGLSGFPESVRNVLAEAGEDRIRLGQYLDFLKLRPFRQSLLCRKGAMDEGRQPAAVLDRLSFSAPLKALSGPPDFRSGEAMEFEALKGRSITTDLPIGKAVLATMATVGMHPVDWATLLGASRSVSDPGDSAVESKLGEFLLRWLDQGLVNAWSDVPQVAREVSRRPRSSRLARWQVGHGYPATTAYHQRVDMGDEALRRMILEFDGTSEVAEVLDRVRVGPGVDPESSRAEFDAQARHCLEAMVRVGLLEG